MDYLTVAPRGLWLIRPQQHTLPARENASWIPLMFAALT